MMLALKALLGAAAVLVIAMLANTKNYFLAGLVPLFPMFAVIANYIVATERGAPALKHTLLFGMFALMPYFVYLASVYLLVDKFGITVAIILGVLLWGVAAALLILGWNRWMVGA